MRPPGRPADRDNTASFTPGMALNLAVVESFDLHLLQGRSRVALIAHQRKDLRDPTSRKSLTPVFSSQDGTASVVLGVSPVAGQPARLRQLQCIARATPRHLGAV